MALKYIAGTDHTAITISGSAAQQMNLLKMMLLLRAWRIAEC